MPADDPNSKAPAAFWLLLGVVFINIAGFSLLLPLLPFLGETFGAAPWQIACLFAAYSLGNLIGEPLWGRLSDRVGRRKTLVVSTACAAMSYIAFAFAPGLWSAIALRIVSGFFSGNLSAVQGFIADVTPPEKRAQRIGFFGAAFNLGFIAGPVIGGLLAQPELGAAGFRRPIFCAAAFSALAAFWALALLKEPARLVRPAAAMKGAEAMRFAARHPIIARILPISFIAVACFSSMEAVFGLWTQKHFGWGPREVGLAFIAVGAAGAITQGFLIGPLSRRFGEARMILGGLALLILATALQPIARDPAASIGLMALLMTGHSFTFPNIAALVSRSTPPDAQGGVLGLNLSATAAGRIIGPPILAGIFALNSDAPYFAAAGLVLCAVVFALQIIHIQSTQTRSA